MSTLGSSGFAFYLRRIWRVVRWMILLLVALYVAIVIYAYPHDHEAHISDDMVAKIDSQNLTTSDVDGTDLPAQPDPVQDSATVAGIDVNSNGVRDDVELAIFAEYPTSSTTVTLVRAAELQYAMDLQMQLTEVFDQNTWKAAVVQRDRGYGCLYDVSNSGYTALQKEVEALVLNTPGRVVQFNSIEQYRTSYELASGPDCDVVR